MYSIIAVTNKHTAKLHHVGSLYILTYDARKLKHKKNQQRITTIWKLHKFVYNLIHVHHGRRPSCSYWCIRHGYQTKTFFPPLLAIRVLGIL